MQIPWEAIVTLIIAIIGFIVWLTKVSVKLDILIKAVEVMAANQGEYAKKEDMFKEIGRLELTIDTAHKRIDLINNSNGHR